MKVINPTASNNVRRLIQRHSIAIGHATSYPCAIALPEGVWTIDRIHCDPPVRGMIFLRNLSLNHVPIAPYQTDTVNLNNYGKNWPYVRDGIFRHEIVITDRIPFLFGRGGLYCFELNVVVKRLGG